MALMIAWTTLSNLVAQESPDGGGWANLLYLLLVVIIPALGQFGAWIRKKYGGEEEGGQEGAARPDGKVVTVPPSKPTARPDIPQARPLAPTQHRPPRPVVRGVPPGRPVAERPAPGAAPSRRAPTPAPPRVVPVGRKPVQPRERPQRNPDALVESGELRATPDPAVEARVRSGKTFVEGQPVVPAVQLGPLTPEDLRKAIVLREVLGSPLALRRPGEASWESV
jgi:hypothetical protein